MIRLPKVVQRPKKRVGRGMGSGKGSHTSGRGQKGQKSRTGVSVLFEGMKTKKSLLKRLPLKRGKGKFHAKGKPELVLKSKLKGLTKDAKVDLAFLIKEGLVDAKRAKKFGFKILND